LKNIINNFLSKQTREIFDLIDQFGFIENFTLVGGSGLAYYLNHRLSEDLDYFTWEATLNKNLIDQFLDTISKNYQIKILNQSATEIDLLIENTKITFFANNWQELKLNRQKIFQNTYIGNIELLTAMKVNTLSMRAKFRDYYDLFVLSKEKYTIKEMFEISKKKMPGLTKKIFAMQISYVEDIDDESIQHLSPKYNVTLSEIHKYFEQQISAFIKN
jgi:predicted nucleotidyltransferase component of viral defense system